MSSKQINSRVFDDIGYGSIDTSEGLTDSQSDPKCTQLESASNLIAVVTGAGMLSLPFAAAAMGWSAILLLVILLLCFMYSYFLLVHSIEQVKRRRMHSPVMIDYVILGKEAFGDGGDKFVLVLLMSELFLALVSFIINIGVNTNVIFRSVTEVEAIVLSGVVSGILSFLDMKHISKFTSCGNIMTVCLVKYMPVIRHSLPVNSSHIDY
jgi:amino acid permease